MHELISLILWAVAIGAGLSVVIFACILMIGP